MAFEPWITSPGQWPAVRTEFAQVTYLDGHTESYQLLSAYRELEHADPELTAAIVEEPSLGEVALSDATADRVAFDLFLDALSLHPQIQRGAVKLLTGEQSNTGVRIGPNALFKMFRRLDPGPNREAEVLAALGPDNGVAPQLFGVYGSATTTWSIIIEYIEASGDGWVLATDSCAAGTDFTAPAAQLGQTLRELHQILAIATPAGEETAISPGAVASAAMLSRLDQAAAEVPAIAAFAPRLRPIFEAVADQPLTLQTVHGDFHLAQALYRPDPAGWVLIDFEGEPAKSPTQRREPDAVWRDVAGALRSFDYVRGTQPDPDSPQVLAWCQAARGAFLAGYLHSDPAPHSLLRAYEMDKAIYEVRYEMRNRPDWAHIPLRTVQDELNDQNRTQR